MRLRLSRLRINVLSGTLIAFFRMGIVFFAYPLFVHRLGYETYGLWLTLGTVLSLAQLGTLGMSPALTKLVAQEYSKKDHRSVQSYLTTCAVSEVVLGAIVVVTILFFRAKILTLFNLHGVRYTTAQVLLPWVAILSVYAFLNDSLLAAVTGLGRFDISNLIQAGGRLASLTISATLLFANVGIWSLLVGDAASYLIVHLASAYALRAIANVGIFRPRSLSASHFVSLFHFGGGLTLTYFAGMLMVPFSKLILSRDVGLAAVSIYEIAYNAALSLRSLIESGLRALNPEISSIAARDISERRSAIKRINRRATHVAVALGIPLFGLPCIMATPLMHAWLGARFNPALPTAFRVIALGAFMSLLGTPAFYTLMGLGRVRNVVSSFGILATVNCGVVILMSACGAASVTHLLLAAALGMTSSTVYLIWALNRTIVQL